MKLAEVASTAVRLAGREPALFSRFRTGSGRSLKVAAESPVLPSPVGSPNLFLRVVQHLSGRLVVK